MILKVYWFHSDIQQHIAKHIRTETAQDLSRLPCSISKLSKFFHAIDLVEHQLFHSDQMYLKFQQLTSSQQNELMIQFWKEIVEERNKLIDQYDQIMLHHVQMYYQIVFSTLGLSSIDVMSATRLNRSGFYHQGIHQKVLSCSQLIHGFFLDFHWNPNQFHQGIRFGSAYHPNHALFSFDLEKKMHQKMPYWVSKDQTFTTGFYELMQKCNEVNEAFEVYLNQSNVKYFDYSNSIGFQLHSVY